MAPPDRGPGRNSRGAQGAIESVARDRPCRRLLRGLLPGPLAILFAYSFYTYRDFDFVSDFTVQNYLDVITGDRYHTYFLRTIKIAFIVSGLVLILSYPFAYLLTFVFRRRRELLYFLVLVSLFGGYLVRIYAWRTMLGREGLINEGLISAGVVDHPLRFFLNSEFAIVITLVNFLLPLGVLPLFSAMQNVSPRLLDAARDLGSSRLPPPDGSCSR